MKVAWMVLALAIAGCSKKDDEGGTRVTTTPTPPPEATPPAAKAPPPTAAPPAAPIAPAAGAARFIAVPCHQLLPDSLRHKHQTLIDEETNPALESALCVFHAAQGDRFVVRAQCYEGATPEAFAATMKDALAPGTRSLDGVGRGGAVTAESDTVTLVAVDDNADCVLTATIPKRIDPAAFAKDLLASWPPK